MAQKKNEYTLAERRGLIEPENEFISIVRQCELLDLARSSYYFEPCGESAENLEIMKHIDRAYTDSPYYGIRRMTALLEQQGLRINHKRVARLYRLMGIEAIYPKPNLSKADSGHQKHPYLLRNVPIVRTNQVWSTDITYIPMQKGFLYLSAIIDWFSRFVIAWNISNTMDLSFCIDLVNKALAQGRPEIFNTDQGSQYTSTDFLEILTLANIRISMDGKGRATDNAIVERLWRTVKYEHVYLHNYQSGIELYNGLSDYFNFYNNRRLHQALDYQTPAQVWSRSTTS